LLVPLASLLSAGGNWDRVFIATAAVTIAAAIAAKCILAPVRRRLIENANSADLARMVETTESEVVVPLPVAGAAIQGLQMPMGKLGE
jgi:OFA family oxalate/formate antiporter-like MFS transporter